MKWTAKQKSAIDTEGRNLLVSAAAGSGKTAVLVERILKKMMRPEHPASILNLLVVTFTNAAAAELKQKIADRILAVLSEETLPPETERHLKKQLILIERADVCTIDSFCLRLVKSEIHLSEFDPAFRIADRAEIELLENDVLSEFMEACYREGGRDFIDAVDYFSSTGAENHIEGQILGLFRYMRNASDPDAWLTACRNVYAVDSAEELNEAAWNQRYLERMRARYERFAERFGCVERYAHYYNVSSVLPLINEYRASFSEQKTPETYQDFHETAVRFSLLNEKALPRKSGSEPEAEEAKAKFKSFRQAFSKWLDAFSRGEEEILSEFRLMRPIAETLIRLTGTFRDRLKEAKAAKRIVDFNDVEHEALRILKENGQPTDVAKAFSERYEEILIDEYQDSSELQEEILNAMARTVDGQSVNVFMVGDMKQSIYRFRMADPELFVRKYNTYAPYEETGALTAKVELSANFRSRNVVTDTVNYFFRKLMQESVDGVGYDDEAALIPKRTFSETEKRHAEKSVFMTVSIDEAEPEKAEDDAPAEAPDEEEAELSSAEKEAHLVAQEILSLVDRENPLFIEDRDHPGKVRPVTFGDIVILMRSTKNADQVFSEVFASYGIPCYSEQKAGFYDTFEIRFLIHFLSAIDNPENDLALFGVLHSGLFSVSSNELAAVKAAYGSDPRPGALYRSVLKYVSEHSDPTAEKLKTVMDLIRRYAVLSHERSLSLLLRSLIGETGLEAFVSAMPEGARRVGNLHLIEEKAAAFEKTSYHGIYNFLRYIARKKEASEDEGEAQSSSDLADPVRLLTMHASKGLQYPVVFVSGLGKKFNRMDERADMLRHQTLGFAIRAFDTARRIRTDSYLRQAFLSEIRAESMGEEMRDLYVAMTRAEEKLYLTGTGKKLSQKIEALRERKAADETTLAADSILEAQDTISLLIEADPFDDSIEFRPPVTALEIQEEAPEENEGTLRTAMLKPVRPETTSWLETMFRYPYHYDDAYTVRSTLSVSLLKRLQSDEDSEPLLDDKFYSGEAEPETETTAEKKSSMRRLGAADSASRGTLYHTVLQHLDPLISVEESLRRMVNSSLLTQADNDIIDPDRIRRFLESGIGVRMRECSRDGRVFREKPFIMSLPVREVFPEKRLLDKTERVMIQGVIDLYFEEPDGIVLVDYKTDRVRSGEELVRRYHKQLEYYEKALVMMTGRRVKERWIYSLFLNEAIPL